MVLEAISNQNDFMILLSNGVFAQYWMQGNMEDQVKPLATAKMEYLHWIKCMLT